MTKEIKRILPVTIRNRRNKREELLQCLVDEEGRFEGFIEVNKARETISWFRQNRNKILNVFRRMQVVQ